MSKTTIVRYCGKRTTAYAERVNTWDHERRDYSAQRIAVRVYDGVAGHYVEAHSLTHGQRRYVIARTLPKAA